MEIRGVIFDLDGTLLDTLDDLADAANETLDRHGFPLHQKDAYRYFVGNGLKVLVERMLPAEKRLEANILTCMETFNQVYQLNWDRKTRPYPGVEDMLQQLRQAGLQLSILSNKPHAFTQLCVQRFFASGVFDYIYGQRDGVPRKPDPAGAVELAALMELEPGQILYVGDTATDMMTGNSAGMMTVGVLWGFRERLELEKYKAGKIIEHPQELVEYVTNR